MLRKISMLNDAESILKMLSLIACLPVINCKNHSDTAASDLRRLNNQRCRLSAHDRQLLARDATALHGSAAVKPLTGRFTNMRVGEGGGGEGERSEK